MKCKKHIIFFLLLCEFMSLFLTTKSLSNKPIDEVKETYEVDKKQFSMYVENDNGKYSEHISSNMFPDGYQINLTKSSCVDTKGKEIDGILSGNKNNVTVTSNKTTYCYIYFDIDRPATEELLATVPEEQLWDSTLEDDGYRYVGTNPDNYICFGTTDQEECMNDTDKYMYRIIGIFEDSEGNQHLKLIKKEALNQKYAWHSDDSVDIDWDESDLYKGINGSYFATNSDYSYMQDSAWNNLITTWNYTATNTKTYENYVETQIDGIVYYYETPKNIYLHEMNCTNKTNTSGEWKSVSSKIGLMYVSDYQLSLGIQSLNYVNNIDYEKLKTGWMHICNNDLVGNDGFENAIARMGVDYYGTYQIWYVHNSGFSSNPPVDSEHWNRPVFYLESDTKLDKGTGTIENPYTLEISPNLREYCEEYNNINECIKNEENNIEEVKDLWNSTLEDDGYRFIGTNPNNYVCFGTTNEEECTSDTDKYMYRIIGIFEDGEGKQHLKLIKKESLNQKYAWHSDYLIDTNWEESDLYKGINGSYFLTNTAYSYMQNENWTNKIVKWEYTTTNTSLLENYNKNGLYGPYYNYMSTKSVYLHELNRNDKKYETCYYDETTIADCTVGNWTVLPTIISLMYASDYLLSLGNISLDYIGYIDLNILKSGWIYIMNNDTASLSTSGVSTPSSNEWTMLRSGADNDNRYFAARIYSTGYVRYTRVDYQYATRPVFYLIENIKITSGKGSITEPFIIS